MADVKPRRTYRSAVRAEQARATRLRILEAAQRRFGERGYSATTVQAIAAEAGVAVDTVFASYGSKRGVLQALLELRVGNDGEPVELLEREGPQAMRAEPDQHRQLELFAQGIAEILERAAPVDRIMRGAAAVDEDIAALRSGVQEQRYRNVLVAAGWVVERGPLRAGMTVEDAATAMWTLTSPEVHQLVREVRGRSREEYARWLASTLQRSLLP